jgi:hypothetical protein
MRSSLQYGSLMFEGVHLGFVIFFLFLLLYFDDPCPLALEGGMLEFTSLVVSVARDVVTCRHILFSFLFTQLLWRSRNPTSQRRDLMNSNNHMEWFVYIPC